MICSRRRFITACTASALLGCAGPDMRPLRAPLPDTAFTMPDGVELPARLWRPASGAPRGVILALHGFNDSRDAWEIPAPLFAQAGYCLAAPDQRGFGATATRGNWPGVNRLVDDALTCLALLRIQHPGLPVVLAGESMGGAVAMLAAARQPRAADGLVAMAPAVWSRDQMNPAMTAALWLAAGVAPGLRFTGRAVPRAITPTDNREAWLRLSRDPLTLKGASLGALRGLVDLMDAATQAASAVPPNSLFLYGGHDQLIPSRAMAALWKQLDRSDGCPAPRRAFYPDGYHLLLRDQDRLTPIHDVLSWISAPDAALPSSAELAAAAWLAGDPA